MKDALSPTVAAKSKTTKYYKHHLIDRRQNVSSTSRLSLFVVLPSSSSLFLPSLPLSTNRIYTLKKKSVRTYVYRT